MRRGMQITMLVVLALVMAVGARTVWAQDTGDDVEGAPRESAMDLVGKAGYIGVVIIVLSAAMFALILTNVMALRRGNLIPDDLVREVDEMLRNKQAKAALERCQTDSSLTGKMMAAGISRMPRGHDQAIDYMGDVGAEGAMKFQHHVSYLSVIGNIAPMLGLLGTVVGMVGAFRDLAASGAQPNPAKMADNIQMALMTTVMGLIVAIPAIFSYALLRNRLARMLTEVDMITSELMGRFQGITTPIVGTKMPPVRTPPQAQTPPTDSPTE